MIRCPKCDCLLDNEDQTVSYFYLGFCISCVSDEVAEGMKKRFTQIQRLKMQDDEPMICAVCGKSIENKDDTLTLEAQHGSCMVRLVI